MQPPSAKRRRPTHLPLRQELVCSVGLLGLLVATPIALLGLIQGDDHVLFFGLCLATAFAVRAGFAALLSMGQRGLLRDMQRSATTRVWNYSAEEWRRQMQIAGAGSWRQAAAVALGWLLFSGSMASVLRGAPVWFVLAMILAVPIAMLAVEAAVIVMLRDQAQRHGCVLLAEQGHYCAGELRTYDNLLHARLRDGEVQLSMPLTVRGSIRVREVVRLCVPAGKLDSAQRYVNQLLQRLSRESRQISAARAFGDSTAR